MATTSDSTHQRYMRTALGLARRGLGQVAPNPAVGCVIVDGDGRVAGRGWTQPGGRPHAETEALARAGERARGATAYVSLEPCAHTGKTGPCADALIAAGIRTAVIAIEDPDPRVAGKGIEKMAAAGIEIVSGVCRRDAERLNAGFFLRVTDRRPLVTLKVASTLDARIATHTGESQWITEGTARAWGHVLRATHDAVMTGATTTRADDPELTCRLPGLAHATPIRIVMDSRLRTPLTAKVVRSAATHPTWIVTLDDVDHARRSAFMDCGVELIEVDDDGDGRPDVAKTLNELARRGITRVLAEGGSNLAATLLRADAVDRIAWFRAPDMMGGDGLPVAQAYGVDDLADMARFSRLRTIPCGRDQLEIYEREQGG